MEPELLPFAIPPDLDRSASWHETLPSICKEWERVFSDTERTKKCMGPKRDSLTPKCTPNQIPDNAELDPEKKAQRVPILYVPLRVLLSLNSH